MASHLKIYFCGSIRGGRNDVDLYARIVKQLDSYGEVLTPFVANKDEDEAKGMTEKEIFERDIRLLKQCHAVVAEVSQPSLGVGVELGRSSVMGKKILCLYRPQPGKVLSAMVRGAEEEGSFIIKDYKEEELPKILEEFFTTCFNRKHKNSINWSTFEPM